MVNRTTTVWCFLIATLVLFFWQGWRSWNAFGNHINKTIIEANLAAITDKRWTVYGREAQLSALNMTAGKVRVRDIWAHSDNGTASGVLEAEVPPADSHFLLLRPAS